jgi:hypothetical protein
MYSDKVRYYRARGMIYVFNLNERKAWIYGFKPFNKRVRFRIPRLLYSSHRFYLLCVSDFKMSDPSIYLGMCEPEWRELILGVSYL